MVPRSDLRLTVHFIPDSERVLWSVLSLRLTARGAPEATLILHGALDVSDPDPVGLDAAITCLLRAVDRAT